MRNVLPTYCSVYFVRKEVSKLNNKKVFLQNKSKKLTALSLGMFSLTLFAGAGPVQAGYNKNDYKQPSFSQCPKPGGSLIAGYDQGEHEIVGLGRKTGGDYVYKIADGMYVQCYFPNDGSEGIQTNWVHEKYVTNYRFDSWYKIEAGSGWGLPAGTYYAKNSRFTFDTSYRRFGGYEKPVQYISSDTSRYDDRKDEDRKKYDQDNDKNYGQFVSSQPRYDDKKYDNDNDRKVVYTKDYSGREYDSKYSESYNKEYNYDRLVFKPVYDTKSYDYNKERQYDRNDSETKFVSQTVQLPNLNVSNVVFKSER